MAYLFWNEKKYSNTLKKVFNLNKICYNTSGFFKLHEYEFSSLVPFIGGMI